MTQQSFVRINWNFGTKRQNRVSHSSLKMLVLELIFLVPEPSLKNHYKKPGTDNLSLTRKILLLPIAHHLGLSMYKVVLDSNKYLLSRL